jgi:hypothetical protein
LDIFFEWWVARQVVQNAEVDGEGYLSRFGGDLYADFRTWREEFGGKYELNGTGDLMKKIYTSLHLPKGCLAKGSRTSKGQRTNFHLENLKKHYNIQSCFGECLIHLPNADVGAGSGNSIESEDEMEMIVPESPVWENAELENEMMADDLEAVVSNTESDDVGVMVGGRQVFFKQRKIGV